MVERPIKKSERQTVDSKSDVVKPIKKTERRLDEGNSNETPPSSEERNAPRSFRGKDKTKGRGKRNQQSDGRPSNVNPALMRGPKPPKSKPPVSEEPASETVEETESETIEDSDTQTEQETIAEG
jgi:hypothetical protein